MQLIKPTPCLTPKQKTKKMHVASVTLTNNNESNEKQMLEKKNWQGSNLMKEPLERFYASRLSTQSTG